MTQQITTVREAKQAGYVRLGEWGDHLHQYREGYLFAAPEHAESAKAAYDADEIRDDSTLGETYRSLGLVWVSA